MSAPIRVLTAVPICDGHDSAINTINLEFIRNGIEVVYLGFHRYVSDIVRAAIQEDVAAVGISSYNGGHIEFFAEVVKQLKKRGADDIKVFGGGGGTITHDDQRTMQKRGVDQIFFAGTSLTEMVEFVRKRYGKRPKRRTTSDAEMKLARKLTEIEDSYANGKRAKKKIENRKSIRVQADRKYQSHRLHRPWRRRQDDADRRNRPASAPSRTASRGSPFSRTIRVWSAKARSLAIARP